MRIQLELCIPRPQLVMKAGPRALRYGFRAANGAPEFARIPARVSGQPQVPARPARRSKLLAHPGASPRGVSGVTARSRGPAARFARGSEGGHERCDAGSARTVHSTPTIGNESVAESVAMRIQSRERGAGVRQNDGQSERSAASASAACAPIETAGPPRGFAVRRERRDRSLPRACGPLRSRLRKRVPGHCDADSEPRTAAEPR
jgi:hypothetical protein